MAYPAQSERQIPRQCPECGCDRWQMRDAARKHEYALRMEREVNKLAARNGVLSWQIKAKDEEHRDHMGRALRKIQRQARVIKRMEERLRALNARPYEGAPLGENAPAAEYDAEHPEA